MSALRAAFPKHLREIRLHFCQKGESSKGVRAFVENNYVELKKANPNFPFLIRECSGIEPRVFARYQFGEERFAGLTGKSDAQVAAVIEELVKSAPK